MLCSVCRSLATEGAAECRGFIHLYATAFKKVISGAPAALMRRFASICVCAQVFSEQTRCVYDVSYNLNIWSGAYTIVTHTQRSDIWDEFTFVTQYCMCCCNVMDDDNDDGIGRDCDWESKRACDLRQGGREKAPSHMCRLLYQK